MRFLRSADATQAAAAPPATINLSKGDKIDLTKTNPGLSKIALGMGWDVKEGETFDLDAFCYLLDSTGKLIDKAAPDKNAICYFNNLKLPGVTHSGDNRTGVGDGDDETITVDVAALPATCEAVLFGVNIYNKPGKSFGNVKNAHIRIYDATGDPTHSIARFDLSEEHSGKEAVMFGRLYKYNNEWKWETINEGKNGNIAELAQPLL